MPALSAPTSSATTPDLGDGIGVLNVHSPFSQTACCLLFISAGSWLDPVGRCGLAHMYEHAFFAGASGLPTAAEVADEAAGLGCRHKVYTHINNTNLVLLEDSLERRAVERAGVVVGRDGMTFQI